MVEIFTRTRTWNQLHWIILIGQFSDEGGREIIKAHKSYSPAGQGHWAFPSAEIKARNAVFCVLGNISLFSIAVTNNEIIFNCYIIQKYNFKRLHLLKHPPP